MKQVVWTFTNKKSLNKKEFVNYFERKVFKTIRKYSMLPKNRVIRIKKLNDLNTLVLKKILEKKFKVEFSSSSDFSSDNLSQVAEDTFKNIIKGDFKTHFQEDKIKRPLYFLSDKEVELYTKLMNIKGTKRKQDKKIQLLFGKFLKKNQDLELNIVNALMQIK